MVKIAIVYKSLIDEDFRILSALERAHYSREYVPLRILEKLTKVYEEKLVLIISKLHELGLVAGETIAGEKAYRLTYLGYDVLAIKSLVKAGILEAMGDKIGEGKESEIYLGLAPQNKQIAVKFLRIGRTSFRHTARVRAWTSGRGVPWYIQSKIAAKREFEALRVLYEKGAYVPQPISYNRHVVVIEYIDGIELYRKPMLRSPEEVLLKTLETIAVAYHRAQIVHGDLSEYNIIVRKDDETPLIIDWPQYVSSVEPHSKSLLKRDVEYVSRFFNKVYGVTMTPDMAFEYVLTWKTP